MGLISRGGREEMGDRGGTEAKVGTVVRGAMGVVRDAKSSGGNREVRQGMRGVDRVRGISPAVVRRGRRKRRRRRARPRENKSS